MNSYLKTIQLLGIAYKADCISIDEYRELTGKVDALKGKIKNPAAINSDIESLISLKKTFNPGTMTEKSYQTHLDKLLKDVHKNI